MRISDWSSDVCSSDLMDYSGITIESVQVPAQDILYVPTSSERNITAVENARVNQLKWLRQVMAKNDLEPAGPYRLITTNFGSDTYDFDVAQPVRQKGSGPAPAAKPPEEEDRKSTRLNSSH